MLGAGLHADALDEAPEEPLPRRHPAVEIRQHLEFQRSVAARLNSTATERTASLPISPVSRASSRAVRVFGISVVAIDWWA